MSYSTGTISVDGHRCVPSFFVVALLFIQVIVLQQCCTKSLAAADPEFEEKHHGSGPLVLHHSLIHPYVGDWWEEGIPYWEVGGDTVVTNEGVRLTPRESSRFGWAWNTQPVDSGNWLARMRFQVRRRSWARGADGLAVWLVTNPHKDMMQAGPLHGMRSDFQGIGVVFDTYDNDGGRDNPMVSVLVNTKGGNPDQWDPDTDYAKSARLRCQFDYRVHDRKLGTIMILTYHEGALTLQLVNEDSNERKDCGTVEGVNLPIVPGGQAAPHYLRQHLGQSYAKLGLTKAGTDDDYSTDFFFGITASTSAMRDTHDISFFSFYPTGNWDNDEILVPPTERRRLAEERAKLSAGETSTGADPATPTTTATATNSPESNIIAMRRSMLSTMQEKSNVVRASHLDHGRERLEKEYHTKKE